MSRNTNTFAVAFPGVTLSHQSQISSSLAGVFNLRNAVGGASGDANAGSGGLSQALQTTLQTAAAAVSQANSQLSQLLTAQKAALDSTGQNTLALIANTASKSGGRTAVGALGDLATSMFGGSILAPIVSGIISLFGAGQSTSQTVFNAYVPPLPVQVSQTVGAPSPAAASSTAAGQPAGGSSSTGSGTQVQIQVNAIDSRSFLDHSDAIAQAVRQALLNSHPLADVISEL